MRLTLQELEAEALSLPAEDRGRLTRRLLDSLNEPGAAGPLTERGGLLLVSAAVEGPWVDQRTLREEYLDEILEPQV